MVEVEPGLAWSAVVGEPAMESANRIHPRPAHLAASLVLGILLTAGGVIGAGCGKDTGAATAQADTAVPAAPASAAEPAAAAEFSEAEFHLVLRPVGEYKAATPARVEVLLEAKAPYKINDKYPFKLELEPTPGVKLESRSVGKDKVTITGKQAVMAVALTPEAAGSKRIAGRFKFSVCNDERCLLEKRDLELTITVN